MKRIKHRTKMRRRMINHSTYTKGSVEVVWNKEEYYYVLQIRGKTKGRHIGNVNTRL